MSLLLLRLLSLPNPSPFSGYSLLLSSVLVSEFALFFGPSPFFVSFAVNSNSLPPLCLCIDSIFLLLAVFRGPSVAPPFKRALISARPIATARRRHFLSCASVARPSRTFCPRRISFFRPRLSTAAPRGKSIYASAWKIPPARPKWP